MAFKATRKNRIQEELQLCAADGAVIETIPVDINIDLMAGRLNKAWEMLGMAQSDLQNNPQDVEAFGNAVIGVFNVIFGEDGTGKILSFYENNYTEMLLDIFPFINGVIMPAIREASAARKAQLVAATKASRPRRFLK